VPCEVVPDVDTFTAVVALFKVELTGGKKSLTSFTLFLSELHNRYAENTHTDTVIIYKLREKLIVSTIFIPNVHYCTL
jgi:siroheme synthase